MRKKQKKILIVILVLAAAVAAGLILSHVLNGQHKETPNGTTSVAGVDSGKYKVIYYKRTNYDNTMFVVAQDDLLRKNQHHVVYYPESVAGDKAYSELNDYLDINPYDLKFKTNSIIVEYLSSSKYKDKVGGYESFQVSQAVTTIVMRKSEHSKYGYAYTFVDDGTGGSSKPKTVKYEAQKFADQLNDSATGIKEASQMPEKGSDLDKYISQNKLKKLK